MSRNFLDAETSPYLLQHKDNPVHWRPWGPEALAAAKAENRPILLSVGYAACHWCHVMAHESFEDPATADVMNRLFVNIKVDREERPDIDTIYMNALHLLGEQGGWPLTMFLTPSGEPFWGGTYFPKTPQYGRPGFTQVLETVSTIFHDEPDKVEKNRAALVQALEHQATHHHPGEPTAQVLDIVAEKILSLIDLTHGGIKGAPKFPQAGLFALLWRAFLRNGDPEYLDAVTRTLDHICEGGIYDHLAGGFARYSVDERWLAPHFEKMLYDNAQLVELLTQVWKETRDDLYARRVAETIRWLMDEMLTPEGAFAASLDADSEGEEGRFYVWSRKEIGDVLGKDADLFCTAYDVSEAGNWEGHNILNRLHRADDHVSEAEELALAPLRAKLLARRSIRIRPATDDKILADWNGLMIAALAEAGATFAKPEWIAAAAHAFAFISGHMVREGRTSHSYRSGKLQHRAMADDLANLARAGVTLFEATGDRRYLTAAEALACELDAHYRDATYGGYFFTADDAEGLIVRTRTVSDDATPAANGTMPGVLVKLGLLTGKQDYLTRADEIIHSFSGELSHNIFPLGSWLGGFETRLRPIQIVVVGEKAARAPFVRAVFQTALPTRVLLEVDPGMALPPGHPAEGKEAGPSGVAAYVCIGESCSLPVTDPLALAQSLRAARAASRDTLD
ncbi:MAG: thioredoxin domain-containing protein [Parvibaculaceae bacterium]|nr:thioredoxin domain-containing protein [Parvibaculaceae bacterium]